MLALYVADRAAGTVLGRRDCSCPESRRSRLGASAADCASAREMDSQRMHGAAQRTARLMCSHESLELLSTRYLLLADERIAWLGQRAFFGLHYMRGSATIASFDALFRGFSYKNLFV